MKYLPLLLVLTACKGIQGGVIGAGTGAAVTGTPQGAGIGAVSGFVVGLWNDITTAVSNWWSGMFGGGTPIPEPSAGSSIVRWIVFLVVFGFLVKFVYHMVWDEEFRGNIIGFFKTLFRPKLRKHRHADPS